MRYVNISPEADGLLDSLWNGGQETLVGRLEDAIDWIAADDVRSRAHRVEGPDLPGGAWLIVVHFADEAWAVVWTEDAPEPAVHAIARTEAF
jgi:hypothetical protein